MIHEIFNLIIIQNSMTHEKRYDYSDLQERGRDKTQRTIDRSEVLHNFTNFFPRHTADITASSIGTSAPTKQGSGKIQTTDQIQTTDHLMTYRLISQNAESGERTCGWQQLTSRRCSIQFNMMQSGDLSHSACEQHTCFLQNLYTDQRATVLTDVESDEFWIAHGKNKATLEQSQLGFSIRLEKDIGTSKQKRLGVKLIDEERETACQTYALKTTCS